MKQGELKKIRREVRKFKFMVSEFKKELHEGIELYDQNKDDPQRLATASVELQRKKKFLEEMSTLRGEKLEKAKIAL